MRIFKNIIAMVIALPLLTGCFDDPGTDIVLNDSFVSLSVESQQTAEDEGMGELLVEISNAQASPVVVSYEITTDNAINGVDFELNSTSVTIPAGEYSANIPYTVVDNNAFEASPRSFTVTLTSVEGGVGIDGVMSTTVALLNNDCPANTSVWFGTVSVEDVGFSNEDGTGAANADGDCNFLVVTGNYVGASAAVEWELIPSALGATSGTAVAVRQPYACCAPAYEYEAEGTYDEETGVIEADYSFYREDGSLWFTGTTRITAN